MTQSRKTGPPTGVLVAAALCGLLAVPMLAAAGSFAATATTTGNAGVAVFAALLALAVLGVAGLNLYGAVQLVQRGTPRPAQLGGYLTIGLTAVLVAGLMADKSPGVVVAVALIFLAPTITMLTLLGTRRSRRWLAARAGRLPDLGTGPRHAIREFR